MKLAFLDSGFGLVPFYEEVLHLGYKHEYYFLATDEFPLGNLSKGKLAKVARKYQEVISKLEVDKTYICCNTLSPFFRGLKGYETILDSNLKLKSPDSLFLATLSTLKLNEVQGLGLESLASLIENMDFEGIVKVVRALGIKTNEVILGCTHYPLVRRVFIDYYPQVNFLDGKKDLLKDLALNESKRCSYNVNKRAYQILKPFAPGVVLNELVLS